MARFRDIKRAARETLHNHLKVEALYLVPASGVPGYGDPLAVTIRVHDKFTQVGDLKGTNLHYAERHDESPKIVFLRSQIPNPMRGAILSVEEGEAYRIDHTEPPENITITAHVTRMTASEVVGLPVPDINNHTPVNAWDDAYFTNDDLDEPYDPDDGV